jgi:hypothetical protein
MLFLKGRSGQVILLYGFLVIAACSSEVKNKTKEAAITSDTITTIPSVAEPVIERQPYAGDYISGEYPDGYYQVLKISWKTINQYNVSFTASQVRGKAACSFSGAGSIVNDTLKVPVEWNDKTVQMTLFLRNDTVMVFTENFDDRFAVNYFCSGGASLIGDYARTSERDL